MKRLALGFAALSLLVFAPALAAPTVDEVADAVRNTGFFIDEGLPATAASISGSVSRARNAGFRFSAVLLFDDPAGGAVTFGDALLVRTGGPATVLVLSETQQGLSTDEEFEQDTLAGALAYAEDRSSDDEGYVSAVVDYLIDPSIGSSGGGGFILLLVLAAVVLLVIWGIRRASRANTRKRDQLLEEARGELRAQISAVADTMLEIADIVSATATSKDDTYLRQASATFTEVEEAYREVTDLRDLEVLSDRLDGARWELDAAKAIAFDKPVPPKPKPTERPVCFFDPTHHDASETAEIQTATGKRTVRVCKADADLLKRGQTPEPRMVNVGGRPVPAPSAPKSHGGSGFDGLDLFTILTSGAATGASYNWGRQRVRAQRNTWSSAGSRRAGDGPRSATTTDRAPRPSTGSTSRAGRTKKRGR
ncbi:MAG: DUF6676 family protein [Acidimicrobiia bacterium]